jgi:DNA-binding NarL/FixJ family response regulator
MTDTAADQDHGAASDTERVSGAGRPERNMAEGQEGSLVVLVASAAAPLRRRWRQAIEARYDVVEAGDRGSVERAVTLRKPVLILLDLGMPDLGGVPGTVRVHRTHPAARLVLLTGEPDEREGIVALKAGARGYCDRDIEPSLLAKAVDVVLKGEVWVGRKLIPHLLEELAAAAEQQRAASAERDDRLERVTPRERQIVELLSAGASNKEIAKRLNVTERTVKAHLTAIFRKLGISGRLQLALFALEHSRRARPSEGIGPRGN